MPTLPQGKGGKAAHNISLVYFSGPGVVFQLSRVRQLFRVSWRTSGKRQGFGSLGKDPNPWGRIRILEIAEVNRVIQSAQKSKNRSGKARAPVDSRPGSNVCIFNV